jgi:hypothetical protein
MRRTTVLSLLVAPALLLLVACGDDGTSSPDAGTPPVDMGGRRDFGAIIDEPVPLSYCPGGPDCPAAGDDVLYAGAGKVDITADLTNADYQTVDVNGNGSFDPRDGDQFFDKDGDGSFEGVWIAGYGSPRAASGVLNPQWARAIAVRSNGTTLVLVSLDVVGYMQDDINTARGYARELGVDFDHLLVSSTHTHEGPDTIGQWGPSPGVTGRDDAYNERINRAIASAAKQAVDALAPAHIEYASFRARDMDPAGINRFVGDNRDPNIIDDEVRILRFTEAADETATLATLVNFAAHAEYTGSENQLLSSDYPHFFREGVENGVPAPTPGEVDQPGLGGICVFFQGALGVQIGPGRTDPRDFDGTTVLDSHSARTAEVLGTRLAQHTLEALSGASAVTDSTAALGYRNYRFKVKIENTLFQLGNQLGVFTRTLYGYNPGRAAGPTNIPWLETEIAVLDIGRARILTAPGELDPMLFVGGKDGSYTPAGLPVVDTTRENPPNLALAPDSGYLRERAQTSRPTAEYVFLFGLSEDFFGYLVPEFDYQLSTSPYITEAPGSHYEEQNSLGPSAWPRIEEKLRALIAWVPPAP